MSGYFEEIRSRGGAASSTDRSMSPPKAPLTNSTCLLEPTRHQPHKIVCPRYRPSASKTSLTPVVPFGVVSPFEFQAPGAEVFGRPDHGGPVPSPRPVGAVVPPVPDLRANNPSVHGKSGQGPSRSPRSPRSPYGRGRSPERFRDMRERKCQTSGCKEHVSHGSPPGKAQGGSHAVANSDTLLAPRGCLTSPARQEPRVEYPSDPGLATSARPKVYWAGANRSVNTITPFDRSAVQHSAVELRATSRHRGHTLACTQQRTTEKGSVNRKNR